MGRLDRFEASTNKRMDYLTKRLDNLSKTVSVKTPASPSKQAKETKTQEAKTQYHLVSKGETLYSISRTYGLTLNELRRLNNLDEKAAIYPGQKLKIK
jgi:LysM repeat protein